MKKTFSLCPHTLGLTWLELAVASLLSQANSQAGGRQQASSHLAFAHLVSVRFGSSLWKCSVAFSFVCVISVYELDSRHRHRHRNRHRHTQDSNRAAHFFSAQLASNGIESPSVMRKKFNELKRFFTLYKQLSS